VFEHVEHFVEKAVGVLHASRPSRAIVGKMSDYSRVKNPMSANQPPQFWKVRAKPRH
jgi:hypothetical protein